MVVVRVRHKEVIYLISSTQSQDDMGNVINEEKERKVYANEFAVSSSEFYSAGVSDLKPSKSFRLHTFEYEGEEVLRHANTRYKVIRTSVVGDNTTLICEVQSGG